MRRFKRQEWLIDRVARLPAALAVAELGSLAGILPGQHLQWPFAPNAAVRL
jgi:hypothetical protein